MYNVVINLFEMAVTAASSRCKGCLSHLLFNRHYTLMKMTLRQTPFYLASAAAESLCADDSNSKTPISTFSVGKMENQLFRNYFCLLQSYTDLTVLYLRKKAKTTRQVPVAPSTVVQYCNFYNGHCFAVKVWQRYQQCWLQPYQITVALDKKRLVLKDNPFSGSF